MAYSSRNVMVGAEEAAKIREEQRKKKERMAMLEKTWSKLKASVKNDKKG